MEKGFTSWFQDQQIDWQSANPNSPIAPFGLRHQLNVPSFGKTTNGNPPVFSGCYPGLTSLVNPILKEQLPVPGSRATHEIQIQKKFLVFDQSNDRTTLIYSSTPIFPKPQLNLDPKNGFFSGIEKHKDIGCSNPSLDDGNDTGSEMHEDTAELRALLYSDDDEIDYSEDDEERSTGNSPMTEFGKQESTDENAEEVASSTGPRKRHKLDNGEYDVVDTASSGKSGINCSGEAEVSSCGGDTGGRVADEGSESFPVAGKRSRKENIRETIRILEDLIPGGKNGKDAMMIIDEAISYLRILKVKAKALGLDSY